VVQRSRCPYWTQLVPDSWWNPTILKCLTHYCKHNKVRMCCVTCPSMLLLWSASKRTLFCRNQLIRTPCHMMLSCSRLPLHQVWWHHGELGTPALYRCNPLNQDFQSISLSHLAPSLDFLQWSHLEISNYLKAIFYNTPFFTKKRSFTRQSLTCVDQDCQNF